MEHGFRQTSCAFILKELRLRTQHPTAMMMAAKGAPSVGISKEQAFGAGGARSSESPSWVGGRWGKPRGVPSAVAGAGLLRAQTDVDGGSSSRFVKKSLIS